MSAYRSVSEGHTGQIQQKWHVDNCIVSGGVYKIQATNASHMRWKNRSAHSLCL